MPAKEMAQIFETEAAKLSDFNKALVRAAFKSASNQRKIWKPLSAFAAEMSLISRCIVELRQRETT